MTFGPEAAVLPEQAGRRVDRNADLGVVGLGGDRPVDEALLDRLRRERPRQEAAVGVDRGLHDARRAA